MFGDPEILVHLRAADPRLAGVIDRVGPCGLGPAGAESPYEALFAAIASQQLTGRAAQTILGRVRHSLGGGKTPSPEAVLAAPDEALRAAGFSRAKTAALKDLAQKTASGRVPGAAALRRMDDEEIVARLTEIRGVGRWTAEMLLMFHLGRPDVLPVADYGVRNGFRIVYRKRKLPSPEQVARHGERWRPWRSVASWYLWRAVDLARADAKAAASEPRARRGRP